MHLGRTIMAAMTALFFWRFVKKLMGPKRSMAGLDVDSLETCVLGAAACLSMCATGNHGYYLR